MSITEHVKSQGSITHDDAVARAKVLASAIRERADAAERARHQLPETIQGIVDAGLVRLLTPARWGGYELGFDTFVDTVIEIGKADAAASWCYSFLNIHAWLLAHFPEEAQYDVWHKTPDVLMADSLIPAGKVTNADNGYRISGSWPWVSGIDHSEWSLLSGLMPTPDGASFEPYMFLIPRHDYEIQDTWFVTGLRASGSKTAVIRDAFVPRHRVVRLADLSEGTSPGAVVNTHPMYQHPLMTLFPSALTAPILGATLGAYEVWRENNRTRATRITGIQLSTFSHQQIRIAETEGEITAAQSFLRRALDIIRSDGPITLEQRIQNHRDYAYLTQLCLRAIERIYLTSGGTANYESNPLQRYWRDVHAMGAHVAINFDTAGETFGRQELGLMRNPNDPTI